MSVENPAVPLSSIAEGDELYDALTGGGKTAAGVKVTALKALGLSAVWRGVNLIANGIGRYPFGVYKYVGETDVKLPDRKHQAARVLRRPNDYMTPFTFRQVMQANALLYGNGYAYISRDAGARPLELLPLANQVWPVRVNGVLWYMVQVSEPVKGKRRDASGFVKIPATDILHIKGLGLDGLQGYPVLKVLRETLGGAIAARDYGARYFRNDASPGIVIQVPAGMTDKAIEKLRSSWSALHKGFRNAHEIAILRDGVTLASFNKATARDAQMLESRAFDARDVANILGVPPHKLGDPSRTAYNSLESENQGYRDDTLGPWFAAWEQECDAKLLTEAEKGAESHCHKFDGQPFSGVPVSQLGAFVSQMLSAGVLCIDEARAIFNWNPLPDDLGKTYRVPVNLAPVDAEPADPAPDPAPVAPDQTQPAPAADPTSNPQPDGEK